MSKTKASGDDHGDERSSVKKLRTSEDESNETSNISILPHEMLLHIFQYLNLKELCRAARVNKRWRQAAYDDFFWLKIDLSDSSVNLKNLWKLIRHRCFSHVESIKLCGHLKNIKHNQQTLTKPLMLKLSEVCPKLREIEINFADLSSISVSDIPTEIEALTLRKCEIPVNWFQTKSKKLFKKLRILDMSGSSRVSRSHLEDLDKIVEGLEVLSLRACYRIDDNAVDVLLKLSLMKSLIELNLDETSISKRSLETLSGLKDVTLCVVHARKCKNILDFDSNCSENIIFNL